MQPFSLLLGLGTLAGLLLVAWRAPGKEVIRYLDAAALVLLIALLSSRALAVAANWGYYGTHTSEIFQVWQGGLSSAGALLGGAIGVFILASWWKLPAGVLADTLIPLAGAITITAWLGCWVDACAYGLPSNAWWSLPARDEWGALAPRVPVQLVGAFATLVHMWMIDRAGRRSPLPGLAASLGLFGISTILFALSYLRADPSPIWQGLRLEAWGSITLMALSGIVVVVLLVRWKMRKSSVPARRVT